MSVAETLFDLVDDGLGAADVEHRIEPDDWPSFLGPTEAARMVVGGPGTGKTQFLVETVARAVADDVDPSRILVLAFSRRGVEDLRRRLIERIGPEAHRILVATSHSLAMRLVERHAAELGWERPPTLLTGVEQEALIADLLTTEDPTRWPAVFHPLLTTDTLASEVTDFVLRAAEQRLEPTDIGRRGRAEWRAMPDFVERYAGHLRTNGRVDYGLILTEALRVAEIEPERLHTFDLVVADEYQDTAPAQAGLLMACVGPATELVVAADPYQSIFSFRGADIENVYTFPDDVRATLDRSCERVVLTTSIRVPDEIMAAAVAVTSRELPGGAGKVLSRRTGGVVACHEFSTIAAEAEWIASDIERVHLLDGVDLERIAVFVRSDGPFAADLARALDRRGIPHTHADERLVDEPVVRFLRDLVRAAAGPESDEASMRRVLLGPFVRAPRGLVSTLPDDAADWPTWIRERLPGQTPIADLLDDHGWCSDADAPTGLWRVWSTVPGLAHTAVDPTTERHRRAWAAYAQGLERVRERGVGRTLREHVELADAVDFEADTLVAVTDGGVTVATMHRAKGTEFDVVFIADANEGTFPDLRHRDSLLGVRHLQTHLPTATADYVGFRLDEERRLAYTAMTRASGRVVWTATVPTHQSHGSVPSRFMRLVAPSTPARTQSEPLTPRSLVAAVRRTVADPEAPPAMRLAGVSWLASGAGGHHTPRDSYGIRRRGSDERTRRDDVRLSPSQAVAFDRCPRRYAIERFVIRRDDDSPYLRVGSAVHEALEIAEAAAIGEGRERSTAEEAHEALDDVWVDHGFGDDRVGEAWYLRARRIIDSLYEGWPSSAAGIAVEVDLEIEIEGVAWSGRVDRIERSGRIISIVDYKTGTTPMTKADAAESLQLGFYALAMTDAGATDGLDDRRVNGAEFWYPAATPNRSGIPTRSLDVARLDEIRDRLADITRAIVAEDFTPTPGRDCARCPVRRVCPAVPVGREAFTP